MPEITGKFHASGKNLFYQSWLPEGDLKAVLVICHGVCEHSGRYMNLVIPLTRSGIAVWAYDHLGCGSSPGQRGHIDSWEDFRSGLRAFLEVVYSNNPGLPIFLYAHSMGALVALEIIQQGTHGLKGVVLSGTPITPAGVGSPIKKLVARLLSRIKPTYSIDLGINGDNLSRDPRAVQAYREDPLVQRFVTVRWGTEAMMVQQMVSSRPDQVRLPVLFIHGSDDPLNLVSGVRSFFKQIPYPNKQLLVYEGSLHEPHNDLEHERVASDLISWLEEHLPSLEKISDSTGGQT